LPRHVSNGDESPLGRVEHLAMMGEPKAEAFFYSPYCLLHERNDQFPRNPIYLQFSWSLPFS
jgi:hypothetical protein